MKMALTVTITLIRTQVVQTNDLFVKKMKGEKNNSKTVTVSLTVQHEQCNKELDIEETPVVRFLSPWDACSVRYKCNRSPFFKFNGHEWIYIWICCNYLIAKSVQ